MAANFGGAQPKTQDQKALDALKTDQYTFVNKDFVKNMAFLNQTVDIHTAYLGKLQSGVDSANENIIEQIQGFAADLFLIFAGMEPTGIDLGDLKYVLQAIGAIFGINPSTPFPMNLFDAVGHMFSNFIVPLRQFTDVIFDTIFAWAHELGFSDDFLDAVKHLKDSVEALGSSIYDFFTRILSIFDIFGIFNGTSGAIGGLFSNILDFFSDIVLPSLKPILQAITNWTVPFINALSGTINTLTRLINGLPLGHITNKQINIVDAAGFDDSGTMESGQGWSWDSTQGRTGSGAAKCIANSLPRQLVSGPIPVDEGQNLNVSCYVKWTGIVYTGTAPITLCLNRYMGENLVGVVQITGVTSPAINQTTWLQYQGNYVTTDDCDSVRISLRVNSNASNGNVWFDDVDLHKQADTLPQTWIANLVPDILGVRTFINNVIDTIISVVRGIPFVGGGLAELLEWLTGWKAGTDATKVQADHTKAGMESTREIMIATITGTSLAAIAGTAPEDDAVIDALSSQTDTIVAQGALLDQIQSQITASDNSGVQAIDLFEEVQVHELNPALWSAPIVLEGTPGNASMETADGHNADLWTADGNSYTVIHRFMGDGAHTLTNFQKVTATINSGLAYPYLDGRRPHHAVVCRLSDDGTKWVRLYVTNNNNWILDYKNGVGVTGTLWNSGADWQKNPGPGSSLSLEAGVNGDENTYRIWKGNTPLKVITDTSHLTDTTQKGHGMGMRASGGWGPGSFTQYSAVDNKPVAIPGYGFRVYRADTSAVGFGGGAQITCFDQVNYDTDNAWDPVSQQYTIPETGWWMFKTRCGLNSTAQNNNSLDPAVVDLRADGAIIELGQPGLIRNAQWANSSVDSVTGIFGPIPLVKGQVITTWMNYARTSNCRVIGDALGSKTFFSGMLSSKNR